MRMQTIDIRDGVTLKTYLWDDSEELMIVKRPAILIFPGGGYFMCSDREAEPIALAYMNEGYNTFVLRYTVRQGFIPPFEDAQNALDLIHKNAEEWRVFPDKIAVCGFSAGGHLASAMGTMAKNKPNAMILGYPAVIGSDWEKLHSDIPDTAEKVDATAPPCFIFSTFRDELVPVQNVITFIDALNKFKIPFECHVFQEGGHGLSLAKKHTAFDNENMINAAFSKWFSMSVDWLKIVFGELEIKEKQKLDIYPAFKSLLKDLAANEKTKAVLEKYVPSVLQEIIFKIAKDAPLFALLESFGLDNNVIEQLSGELEKCIDIGD